LNILPGRLRSLIYIIIPYIKLNNNIDI